MKRPVPEVTKRDGSRQPFDPGKIARAVHRAAMAAGVADDLTCEELAAAATMVLEQRFAGQVPSTTDLREVVECVLMETGHAEVARQFILRAASGAPFSVTEGELPKVQVRGIEEPQVFRWQDLSEELLLEPGIGPEEAEVLARRVEDALAFLPWSPVPDSLVREVILTILQDQGFEEAARARQCLGMTRTRLDSLLAQAVRPGRSTESRVGEALLEAHALEEHLPAGLAQAHRSGDLEVDGLATPGRALSAVLSFRDVVPARAERSLAAVIRLARELGQVLVGSVSLAHVDRLLALGGSGPGEAEPAARSLLLALAEGAADPGAPRPARTRLVLGAGWSPEELAALFHAGRNPDEVRDWATRFCRALVGEAGRLVQDLALPRLCLVTSGDADAWQEEERELQALEQAGVLVRQAAAVEIWPLSMVGARVGVNVARLALRTGRRRERAFLHAVREATQAAVAACACRLRGLMARDDAGWGPLARLRAVLRQGAHTLPFDLPGRHTYHCHVIPVGLGAAVRAVTEYDAHESERARELQAMVLEEMHQAIPSGTQGGATFEIRREAFGRAERRFGRQDFEAYPRGRDILRLSHDGDAYRYGSPRPPLAPITQEAAGPGAPRTIPTRTARAGTSETAHPGRNPAP